MSHRAARYGPPRPTEALAILLTVGLSAFVPVKLLDVATLYAMQRAAAVLPADQNLYDVGSTVLAASQAVSCVQFALFLALAVLFPMFFSRANKNLRSTGLLGLDFTPGWAAGWCFVPLANLVKPHAVASELWRASAPMSPEEQRYWRSSLTPRLVHVWWAAWIVMNLAGSIAGQLGSIPDSRAAQAFLALEVAGTIAAAWAGALLVCRLHQRVSARVASAGDASGGYAADRDAAWR